MRLKQTKFLHIVFLLVMLFAFRAPTITAQKVKGENVTIDVTSVTIGQLFTQLKKQTGYNFVISSDLAQSFQKVTVKAVDKPLNEVLKQVLSRNNCTFDIDGRTITILRLGGTSRQRVVKGVVRDASGSVLPGVPVCIGDSRVCTVTDDDGFYTFKIPFESCDLKFT